MTVLHADGKFDKNSHKVSGGLHGVGVSCVNALSEVLKVWVKRDGHEYYMDFRRGDTTTKLKTLRDVPRKETGTKVWFKPDAEIFTESAVYDFGTLQMLLSAGIDDLQAVEGVGELRARSVREGLSRLAESSILERYV